MFKTISTALFTILTLTQVSLAQDEFKPKSIDFSNDLATYQAALGAHCESVTVRRFDPPELPGTEREHLQLDCEGFNFWGKPRLAEFVFRDGILALVWILTNPEEEAVLEAELKKIYGQASHTSRDFTAFTAHQSALRKDVPEVLFYSTDMAPMFEAWFSQNAGQ